MLENSLKLYGIDDELIIDYEDVNNTYLEYLEDELENEILNIRNIYEIATSFNIIHSFIYPEYQDNTDINYNQNNYHQERIITIFELIKKRLDIKNKNDIKIIKILEQNIIRDYWSKNQKIKKLN